MNSLRGRALVASPYLGDPNFMRTVVYMLQHTEDGALGLVLNRPTATTVGYRFEQLIERRVSCEAPLYRGGPVDGPMVMLHQLGEEPEAVYIETDYPKMLEICSDGLQDENRYRVFEGYSGWAGGQLESEMADGGWLIWDLDPAEVFRPPDEIWQFAVRQIGREILSAGIPVARMPKNPGDN